jgi:hypothetical protein
MKFKITIIAFIIHIVLCVSTFASIQFAHITDLHIFEDKKRQEESQISATDFTISINKINEISKNLKTPLAFVLLSGDIGVGKLLSLDPKTGKLIKDPKKWPQAIDSIVPMLKNSTVKTWLLVPGNNDLYEEKPESIQFYSQFLKELQARSEIKQAGLSIVDFRLDATQKAQPASSPGMYALQNFIFVGWDNSFFKNNNSVKNYMGKDGHLIPLDQTIEYQSLKKLKEKLESSKAKYAYIFYHIPEIDDPYLILFDESQKNNIVSKRLDEAKAISPSFAQGLYPYSAWTVPLGVRQLWEKIVTRNDAKAPIIKGLFAGHFHDHKKETYLSTLWVKSKKYKDEILKKLYIAPPVSVKNQTQYPNPDRATGLQIITIQDDGNVLRKPYWFD